MLRVRIALIVVALAAGASLFLLRSRPPQLPAVAAPAPALAIEPAPAPLAPEPDRPTPFAERYGGERVPLGFVGPEGQPTRELVGAALRADLAEHLPDRKLSSDELEQLTDALMRLRDARTALAGLPVDAEHAERGRELRRQLGEAVADFEYVLELSPAEFTALAQSDSGLSDPDEPPPVGAGPPDEPVYLKDLDTGD